MNRRLNSARAPYRARLAIALVVGVVAAGVCWLIVRAGQPTTTERVAYAAQPERNFMAIQRNSGELTEPQVVQLARNYNVVQINSADADGRLAGQSDDARRIVALNPSAKVYAYYPLSFMSARLSRAIETLDSRFNFPEQWYLHDAAGQRILYPAGGGTPPDPSNRLYYVDLSNAHFRAWIIALVSRWMQTAPWAGIKYDTAEYLVGDAAPSGGAYGTTTMNDLLCGPGLWDSTRANCPRVSAWNSGLKDVIEETVARIHPLGKRVFFNGIAPPVGRASNRTLGLLAGRRGADGALDESFCFRTVQLVEKALPIRYTNVLDDIRIMRDPAYVGKQLLFQSNYFVTKKLELAHYCVAAFLMGWQPGRDYYRFGESYEAYQLLSQPDPSRGYVPTNGIAEIDLNLGNPKGSYVRTGGVLSRRFQNGFVAVNVGSLPARVILPPTSLVRFSDGRRGATYKPGSTVTVAAHNGVFFLADSYLRPWPIPWSR